MARAGIEKFRAGLVASLGQTFRSNDDMRAVAAAVAIVIALRNASARVQIRGSKGMELAQPPLLPGMTFEASAFEHVAKAYGATTTTAWDKFRALTRAGALAYSEPLSLIDLHNTYFLKEATRCASCYISAGCPGLSFRGAATS